MRIFITLTIIILKKFESAAVFQLIIFDFRSRDTDTNRFAGSGSAVEPYGSFTLP